MGCVVLGGHLYVAGGTNRHNEVLQSVERYSFEKDTWELLPPMREPREEEEQIDKLTKNDLNLN
jgi:hypothetical protein